MKNTISKVILIGLVLTLLVGVAVSMTACSKKVPLKGISFEDGVLSWDKDSIVGTAANAYSVFVNKAKQTVGVSDDGKKFFVNLKDQLKGNFDVKVKAKGKKVEIEQTIEFRRLPDLNVQIVDGVFDWSESAKELETYGSVTYDLMLDDERLDSTVDDHYRATTGVDHTLLVRPRVYHSSIIYYAEWSKAVTASVFSVPSVTSLEWRDIEIGANDLLKHLNARIKWTSPTTVEDVQYLVKINGKEVLTTVPELNTAEVEGLDVTDGFTMTVQTKSLTAAAYDSPVSEEYKAIYLTAPKQVEYADGFISFDEVKNAARYEIYINGKSVGEVKSGSKDGETNPQQLTYEIPASVITEDGQVTLRVSALPGDDYDVKLHDVASSTSKPLTMELIKSPMIVYDRKGFVILGNDNNAKEYQIRVEKGTQEVVQDGSQEVTVPHFSEVTDQAGNPIIFKQDVGNTLFNQYDFADEGVYYLSVRAIAKEGVGKIDSLFSKRYEVIRLGMVTKLAIEEVAATASAESALAVKVMGFSQNIKLVSRFRLTMNGTEISYSSDRTEFIIPRPLTFEEASYNFTIQAVSDDDGASIAYILKDTDVTSGGVVLSSNQEVAFSAVKLATPRDVCLNAAGSVSWSMPAPQNQALKATNDTYNDSLYDYKVVMNQLHHVDKANVVRTENGKSWYDFTFPSSLAAGEVEVNVYAQSSFDNELKTAISNPTIELSFAFDEEGNLITTHKEKTVENSVVVLSSDYSVSETFVRLDQPTDLKIENQILYWSGVLGAVGYNVHYSILTDDGEALYGTVTEKPLATTSFRFDQEYFASKDGAKLHSLIQNRGCMLTVVAVGNKGLNDKGEPLNNGQRYSFDSKPTDALTFYRNDAPTGLQVNDDNLFWNMVPNASFYLIYNKDTLWRTVESTSISIAELKSGNYEMRVIAGGDQEKFFNSDYSEALTFRKLEEVNVQREGDLYVWRAEGFARQYRLTIDGKPFTVEANAEFEAAARETTKEKREYCYSFKPTFTVPKAQTEIKLRAYADNGSYNEDAEMFVVASSETLFYQRVERVDMPQMRNDGAGFELTSSFETITITANVKDAPTNCTYKYTVATIAYYSDDRTLTLGNTSDMQPGDYLVKIAYGANFFGDDDAYYLDSENAEVSANITFLRETYEINVQGMQNNYTISWKALTNAASYRVFYDIYEVEGKTLGDLIYTSKIIQTTDHTLAFALSDLLKEAYDSDAEYAIKIQIVTVGNNQDSVSFYEVAEDTKIGLH